MPDQPANGIGGSVNIISKSGFEAKRPVFDYKVYLITDGDARARFAARSKALSSIRQFMVEHHFMEVETPMLHTIPEIGRAHV